MKNILILASTLFLLSGCLQTRNESTRQSQAYRKKNADNQAAEAEAAPRIDERDELIRALNGRIETLEGQLTQIQREKSQQQQASSAESQKIAALQESLTKMEAQLQKLEADSNRAPAPAAKSSDEETLKNINVKPSAGTHSGSGATGAATANKGKTPFEIGEDLFKQKEWKKAILSYQKHVEEYPKGKSVPEAKYKTGVSFQELGLKDEAIAFYEEVIAQYPKTEAGKKAKIRLTGLQSKNKQKK